MGWVLHAIGLFLLLYLLFLVLYIRQSDVEVPEWDDFAVPAIPAAIISLGTTLLFAGLRMVF